MTTVTILVGDALARLRALPDESVQMCVTSPPYWGLRNYGVDGQIGMEPTPEAYVANLVAVFREVRRVLRDDGTLWLVLGDSYASGKGTCFNPGGGAHSLGQDRKAAGAHPLDRGNISTLVGSGLKPKDLIGIPWRVAFALQAPDYLGHIRSEVDRAWLAALVDGEGCITILESTSPHGSGSSYPPVLQIRMCDVECIQKAAHITGYGSASPPQEPPSQRGQRPSYQWRLHGRKAADIIAEIYPFLLIKRKQAIVAWNHQAVRDGYEIKRGVKIPTDALAKQLACRDLAQRLNRREAVDIPSWMIEPPQPIGPGWYLRSDVIWHKPNPMPESVTDRPTRSHEDIFLLTKSARYFYDAQAIHEPLAASSIQDSRNGTGRHLSPGSKYVVAVHAGGKNNGLDHPRTPDARKKQDALGKPTYTGFNNRWKGGVPSKVFMPEARGRNARDVWTVAPAQFREAHFATFPEKLIEPCIKAGTSERGACAECGTPWTRRVTRSGSRSRHVGKSAAKNAAGLRTAFSGYEDGSAAPVFTTTGWERSCHCETEKPSRSCIVLDPFGGAGTTGLVAAKLGRSAILIELNPQYSAMAQTRIETACGLLTTVTAT